jgi:hypothetical protein
MDTMAAPAGKPVSMSCHSMAPVADRVGVHGQPHADHGDAAARCRVGQPGTGTVPASPGATIHAPGSAAST